MGIKNHKNVKFKRCQYTQLLTICRGTTILVILFADDSEEECQVTSMEPVDKYVIMSKCDHSNDDCSGDAVVAEEISKSMQKKRSRKQTDYAALGITILVICHHLNHKYGVSDDQL